MEKFTIELNYEEAKSLVYATKRMSGRLGGGSRRNWNAKRLSILRQKYSEQKNLDAVCLAANGGDLSLLSGESGRIKEYIKALERHFEFEYRRAQVLFDVCQRIYALLPPLPEKEDETEK